MLLIAFTASALKHSTYGSLPCHDLRIPANFLFAPNATGMATTTGIAGGAMITTNATTVIVIAIAAAITATAATKTATAAAG